MPMRLGEPHDPESLVRFESLRRRADFMRGLVALVLGSQSVVAANGGYDDLISWRALAGLAVAVVLVLLVWRGIDRWLLGHRRRLGIPPGHGCGSID